MNRVEATGRLWDLIDRPEDPKHDNRSPLPVEFIDGLRACLEAGMSCRRVSAFLLLAAGTEEADDLFDGDELMLRAEEIMRVVQGLIDGEE